MVEIAIALPFTIDSFGKVVKATTQEKIWADRVRSVIGTSLRERVMRPTFGCSVSDSLFGSVDETRQDISSQIEDAFSKFLPDLELVEVIVNESPEQGKMEVEIVYNLPNEKEVTVSIGYIDVYRNTPPYEQLISYQETKYE